MGSLTAISGRRARRDLRSRPASGGARAGHQLVVGRARLRGRTRPRGRPMPSCGWSRPTRPSSSPSRACATRPARSLKSAWPPTSCSFRPCGPGSNPRNTSNSSGRAPDRDAPGRQPDRLCATSCWAMRWFWPCGFRPRPPRTRARPAGFSSSGRATWPCLERLIRVVNTIQQESGELAGVADRQRNGTTYHVREFPAAANRPSEWYVVYPDGTFAFSNSEALIQSVIDRKGRSAGWPRTRRQARREDRSRPGRPAQAQGGRRPAARACAWPGCSSTPGTSSGCWRPRHDRASRPTPDSWPCSSATWPRSTMPGRP